MLLSPESSYNERKAGQVAELLPAVASGGVWLKASSTQRYVTLGQQSVHLIYDRRPWMRLNTCVVWATVF
ncbi:hypothetical protein RRG08_017006 [Elysia crispata]|uniref:Uncharacterized protein n=1 Tax=Elysia crispata TaxID=231223 RepID=A0AAE0XZ35_9GAST|nr:hypothetical protein RRG08_017006 [Elysia crispata]